jgi:hypothetical protein
VIYSKQLVTVVRPALLHTAPVAKYPVFAHPPLQADAPAAVQPKQAASQLVQTPADGYLPTAQAEQLLIAVAAVHPVFIG